MTEPAGPSRRPSPTEGSRTAAEGTPFAVDLSRDRRARLTWVVFLAGPVIWITHFMVVYLAVEAGCTGSGPGLRLFEPPVADVVTLAATAVAGAACLGTAAWGRQGWRAAQGERADRPDDATGATGGSGRGDDGDQPRDATLAFAGFLLSLLSFVAVLFVGLPSLVLPTC